MSTNSYWIYFMASNSGTLYIGITNNLSRRTYEHQNGLFLGFTQKYGCRKLVYFEQFSDVTNALSREKQLKKWNREKKMNLIRTNNPGWTDLGINL